MCIRSSEELLHGPCLNDLLQKSNHKNTSPLIMSELNAPRTPEPDHAIHRSEAVPFFSPTATKDTVRVGAGLGSPVPDMGAMTPPPSTQLHKPSAKASQGKFTNRREHSLVSPPATLRIGPPITSGGLFGELPSAESVQKMGEEQLRGLVTELLPAFGQARVNAAHSKLQHSLLSIETEEAAKRAAVEHEATRREVQVLQEGSPAHYNSFSPQSPQASMQRNLQLALAHCRDLQSENTVLEKRLRSSKRLIHQLDEQNSDLKDSVQLLRQRIKENRDHLNEMQSSGTISINGTPSLEYSTALHNHTANTPATAGRRPRDTNLTPGSQDPFDALLLAGQVMNGEASSVPTSPLQARAKKLHPQHLRGAHSLSSLPTTPLRSRPVTADDGVITLIDRADQCVSLSAPGTRLTDHEESRVRKDREDRESTISASDDEDNNDIPGSQASQMATSMLRRSLGSPSQSNPSSSQTVDPSKVVQAKLFGNVTKPGVGATNSLKRGADSNRNVEVPRSNKKARTAGPGKERVGLGIQSWAIPG